jgi:hypothetical protein
MCRAELGTETDTLLASQGPSLSTTHAYASECLLSVRRSRADGRSVVCVRSMTTMPTWVVPVVVVLAVIAGVRRSSAPSLSCNRAFVRAMTTPFAPAVWVSVGRMQVAVLSVIVLVVLFLRKSRAAETDTKSYAAMDDK